MAVHYGRHKGRPGVGGPGVGDTPEGVPLDVANRLRPGARRGYSAGGYSIRIPGQATGPAIEFSVGLPVQVKPPSGVDFNMDGTQAGITSASGIVTLDTFQVPPGNVGVVRSFSLLANGLLTTSDIRWALLFDGVPVPGWNSLTINPRSGGSVEVSYTPDETYIRTPEGSLLAWTVQVLDGGTYQVSVSAHGWFYPAQLATLESAAYPR